MRLISTARGTTVAASTSAVNWRTAVMYGLAPDGGLYWPMHWPKLQDAWLAQLPNLTPLEIALALAKLLLADELPAAVLERIVSDTFTFPLPVHQLNETTGILELFHGPTLAFKDVGARFMARLMGYYVEQEQRPLTVLVATSGDTGSAVAHGFWRVPGIRVFILYPAGRISRRQEQQLATLGDNITALAVAGSFDDCQQLTKQALVDPLLRQQLWLTSANSINIARLLPQGWYYFIGFSQLPEAARRSGVVVSVPSGNFGNLTAGVIAQRLGLPIAHWIAATNANKVVAEYLSTGQFNPRSSVATLSNAMDVGNPSNFVRLLELFNHSLPELRQALTVTTTSDADTQTIIKQVWQRYHYLFDPHTAVAFHGLEQYRQQQPSDYGLCLATAHPAKFVETVAPLVGDNNVPLPAALAACLERPNLAVSLPNDYAALREIILQ